MPTRGDHLNQAAHNQSFYASFHKARYPDWAVTVLFYTGLHYVDAFLASLESPQHPGSHPARRKCFVSVPQLAPIWDNYRTLEDASRNARYNPPIRFSLAYIDQLEQVHLKRIAGELRRYVPIP